MDFWEWFFLFLIYIPLVMVWAMALIDIFRRDDIRGVAKAAWVLVVFVLPFLGTLIYLLVRPVGATAQERAVMDTGTPEYAGRFEYSDETTQLNMLANLHDRGKLTDEEFAAEKARIMGRTGAAPA